MKFIIVLLLLLLHFLLEADSALCPVRVLGNNKI